MRAIRGDGEAALADCNKALQAGESMERYDSRGFAYLRLGQFGKAITDYNDALRLGDKGDSLLAYPLYGRGVARLANKDLGGKADIEAARSLDCKIDENMAKFGVKPSSDAGPAKPCEESTPGKAGPHCPRGWLEVIGLR